MARLFEPVPVCRRGIDMEVETMSVALDWQDVAPVPEVDPRPRLTLVPPLPAEAEPRPGLTRRGRLLRTLLAFTLLMIAVLRVVDPAPEPPDLSTDHSATVRAGQTLTDVAREHLPALATEEGVRRIRLVNGLQNTVVYAGQSLDIPPNR